MASCQFSEFSFGYALTDSLVNSFGPGAAPVFANQVVEGKPGGGYDMKLPLNPVPMFFQFKIPAVLTRASKHMPKGYWTPYYRMVLRTKQPDQHALLLDLERKNPLVYYATPIFDRIEDLDYGFVNKSIQTECAFIRPSRIGVLDSKPHHVSYKRGFATCWVHSLPRELDGTHNFDDLLRDVRAEAAKSREASRAETAIKEADAPWTARNRTVLFEIKDWLVENRRRDRFPSQAADNALLDVLDREFNSPAEMARDLGYVAQVHYGITLAFSDAEKI